MSRLELAQRFRSRAEGLEPGSQASSSAGCSWVGRSRRSRQPKKAGHRVSCCRGARLGMTPRAAFWTGGRLPAANQRFRDALSGNLDDITLGYLLYNKYRDERS
jgi:hypothetical protein